MKPVLIKQPIGLGDVFFCQKIAHHYASEGHDVIWPLHPYAFNNIKGYIEHDKIQFVNIDDDFANKNEYFDTPKCSIQEYKNCIVVTTDGCKYDGLGVMRSKYKLANLNFDVWDDYFKFTRNKNKEDSLYYNILGLNDGDEYILVNENIGSPGYESIHKIIYPKDDNKIVSLKQYDGYSIFDWSKVIENAKGIYVMETSITYLIDCLTDTKANTYHMFARNVNTSEDFIDYVKIYKNKPWIFYDSEHKIYNK